MGCRKLTYGSEADIPFFRDYQSQGQEAVKPFLLKNIDSLRKKVQSEKKCDSYYPFGMVMAGTAYDDISRTDQLHKFNGNEVLEGEGIPSSLNLMNFNARLYNPALGVFLAIDPMATSFAGLTPYNFGFNNPTLLSDPNGECPVCPFLIILAKAAITGAAIGGAGYTASVAFSDGGFQNWNAGQFWRSVGVGAISGVVTAGIGSAFGAVGSAGIGGEVGRAFAHGYSNMMIGAAFGQDPTLASFAAGALGSLAGSALHKAGSIAQIGGSSLTGGIGAELSGGDFWRGAATGATVAAANHVLHGVVQSEVIKTKIKRYLDGLELKDGTVLKREKLRITLKEIDGSLAKYTYKEGGKFGINYNVKLWRSAGLKLTYSNVRSAAVHEVYGHGILKVTHINDHYYAYEGQIEHTTFKTATIKFQAKMLSNAYDSWFSLPGNNGPFPYQSLWDSYR